MSPLRPVPPIFGYSRAVVDDGVAAAVTDDAISKEGTGHSLIFIDGDLLITRTADDAVTEGLVSRFAGLRAAVRDDEGRHAAEHDEAEGQNQQ